MIEAAVRAAQASGGLRADRLLQDDRRQGAACRHPAGVRQEEPRLGGGEKSSPGKSCRRLAADQPERFILTDGQEEPQRAHLPRLPAQRPHGNGGGAALAARPRGRHGFDAGRLAAGARRGSIQRNSRCARRRRCCAATGPGGTTPSPPCRCARRSSDFSKQRKEAANGKVHLGWRPATLAGDLPGGALQGDGPQGRRRLPPDQSQNQQPHRAGGEGPDHGRGTRPARPWCEASKFPRTSTCSSTPRS